MAMAHLDDPRNRLQDRFVEGSNEGPRTGGTKPAKFRFLHDADLESLPDPEWLIEGVLPTNSISVLFGLPAAYKSFLATDWCLSIATGADWAGRKVKQGTAVYVAAEGATGYKLRFRSWKEEHSFAGRAGVYLLPGAVQLHDEKEVAAFLASMVDEGISPILVTFDTLSRCFVGAEENSAASMSLLVEAAEKIRRSTGATVLLVHHANKGGEVERGSIALRAGIDVLMVAKKDERNVQRMVLRCKKMKDAPDFDPMHFRFVPRGDSGVLIVADAPKRQANTLSGLGKREETALSVLSPTGMKHREWKQAAELANVAGGSFGKIRTELIASGRVTKDENGTYWPSGGDAPESIDSIHPLSGYTEIPTEAPPQADAPLQVMD
jgi:hypothetical protein